jgi:hypothetical protein
MAWAFGRSGHAFTPCGYNIHRQLFKDCNCSASESALQQLLSIQGKSIEIN